MKIQVTLDLSEQEIKDLAYKSRTLRADPRKSWRMPEYKEHARYAVQQIIRASLTTPQEEQDAGD